MVAMVNGECEGEGEDEVEVEIEVSDCRFSSEGENTQYDEIEERTGEKGTEGGGNEGETDGPGR